MAIATLFGIGFVPLCPGSVSCLLAALIFWVVKSQFLFLSLTLISLAIAFYVSSPAEEVFKEKDCKKIVIDDFSGMLITYLFIPQEIIFIISGFFLFRMLDMLKVPPADRIEKLKGARGIVGDDLVAGIYANFILQVVRLLLKISS